MNKTLSPCEWLSLQITTVIRDSSLGKSLLFRREEMKALVGVLREIDNPEVGNETNGWNISAAKL